MMLTIENISSGYGNKTILKNLSLQADAKQTLVLMGPSGCGKTTLLLTILGIVSSQEGKVTLDHKDVTNLPIENRNIGYLPQDYGLFPHMNVNENISFGLKVRNVPKDLIVDKTTKMLELVDLPGYGKRKINELSGGEKQRVALARALAIEPSLLLLDEPLSNIDQVTKHEVADQLKQLFQKLNIPIILVTHNYEDAIYLADTIAIMIQGKIEQVGKIEEVMNHPKNDFIKKLLKPFA
ncbi:MAG: ABC transporter ATP-binding protein [Chlamydiae bacterium]|nr:ABC transporter ATP-binding protein [Chlamydiota bacterium]